MTHQYKQMQKEYNDELESLSKKLVDREDELSKDGNIQERTIRLSPRLASSRTTSLRARRMRYLT